MGCPVCGKTMLTVREWTHTKTDAWMYGCMVITINGTVMYVNQRQIQINIVSNVVFHVYPVFDTIHAVLVDESHLNRNTKCLSLQIYVRHNKECTNIIHLGTRKQPNARK